MKLHHGTRARRTVLSSAMALTLGVATFATSATAQDLNRTMQFEVAVQPVASALNQFAEQADVTLVFSQDAVAGITARPLRGNYTMREGLTRMLAGTGLGWQSVDDRTISIVRDDTARTPSLSEAPQDLEKITVTGTRIRGGTTPSPLITIGSERIQEEGFADLGEVIRSIPQNFSGGQNPGAGSGNIAGAGNTNQNLTGGSGLNLRGLGPDATLTLLNGRRLAYSGYIQSVDISAIPVDAVERVEVVADGASAIYGSDAVGGVANVILKRDFDGFAVRALHGRALDGGLGTRDYTATAGATWSDGGMLVTYKDATTDPIYARDRRYTGHLPDPATLYPGSDLRSGLLSIHQGVGDHVQLRLDALRTERDVLQYYNYSGRNFRSTPATRTSLIAPGILFSLPKDWTLSLGGSRAKDDLEVELEYTVVATGVTTLGEHACVCNESFAYELGAEGPLFRVPGGDARMAAGIGYRKNEFLWESYLPGVNPFDIERVGEGVRFAYAEMSLPLVDPAQSRSGVHRLLVTGALRREDYDSFGATTTPKLGVIYGPNADFSVKLSWGRSFKAPTLMQQHYPVNAYLYAPQILGGNQFPAGSAALILDGGNRDLSPERAKTWTGSLVFHPASVPGLEAELTWFGIDYTDRVLQPIANVTQAFSNPDYAEFIDLYPSAEAQAELIASADGFANYSGFPYDPANVVAIVWTRFTNVATQKIRGIDLGTSYRRTVGPGRLTVRGAATWLDSTQQTSSLQAPLDLAGTLFNPPHLSGRMGMVWQQGGFTASAFANHRGGVTNRFDGVKSGSFTTLDGTFRYSTSQDAGGWSGVDVSVSVNNILDRAPPTYTLASAAAIANVPPFDQTNYSAIGRHVAVSIGKRW